MSRRPTVALPALALLCLGLLAGGCGSDSLPQTTPAEKGGRPAASPTHFRFFSPTSFWNTPLPDRAPLDPESARLTKAFDAEVESEQASGDAPWIGTTRYSVPIYTVGAQQPTVPVQLDSQYAAPALRSAFAAVPLPPGARPSASTDGHLVLWQHSSDRLW